MNNLLFKVMILSSPNGLLKINATDAPAEVAVIKPSINELNEMFPDPEQSS